MTPTTTRSRKPRTPPEPPADALVMAPTTNGAGAPATPPAVQQDYVVLPVTAIRPGPHNPRRDLGDLDGLAASIRAVGIQEPLLVELESEFVRSLDDPAATFMLLAGHRRLAAALLAGMSEVPCMVRVASATPAERMEIALVENLQREGLAPLDEADGYATLVDLGLSQRAIAERVGCSQSHVSKRLQLRELPSHVQARIVKGTLPIEAALALVRLKGHPDKLKKAAGADPSVIGREVERWEQVIAWEAKRDELVAVAKDKGWPVVHEPAWSAKKSFATLAHWNGPPELDLDAKKHQAEPCHGVMIPSDPPQWYSIGTPTATSVCTEPARHGPKGASTLKARHGPKGASTLKAKVHKQAKRQPAAWEIKEAQERNDRKAAAEARAVVLAAGVAAYRPPARPSIELTLTVRASVGRMMGWDVAQVAGELLGLEPPEKGQNWYPVIENFAAQGTPHLHRTALALALATAEVRLRGNYGGFGDEAITDHYDYLATLGYQPSPWEQAKLDEAAEASRAGD